jgi:hemolysin activation/secretion protein
VDFGRVAADTSGLGQDMAGAALGLRLQGTGSVGLSGWAGDIAARKLLLQPSGLARTGTVFYASVSFMY